ncbi:cell wall-active antibiotics response protein LiaF [Paenibacillus turpanensis]|uniref:cell wall-active antibiotics response protein LiaF n=1 Tax=Paenibacillus turpanensis TaxID=2689078 RepID=UPI00140D047A|nr:cell wall-active antibiotics response protein LiaF [Paenibacillus turpanensis]
MDNRNRNTALVLIVSGFYLLAGHLIGFMSVTALIIILMGVYKLRYDADKKSYVLLAIGFFILIGQSGAFSVALILILCGLYFIKSKGREERSQSHHRQGLVESLRWDRDAWVLKSMSMWFAVSEVRMDFSLAMPEEKETTVIIQGVVGDIDIIVPEDFGIQVESSIMLGQTQVGGRKESGIMNKFMWKSPHYETSAHKVRLILSYGLADVDIKVLG